MPLPPIAFFTIYEASLRWRCHPADIAGWAATGDLQVLAGIPPVMCGKEMVAGLVEVAIAELMSLFRRVGPSVCSCQLRRVRACDGGNWLPITDPAEGIPIESSDLLLAASTLQEFEDERGLLRRQVVGTGANPRYDWDAMYAWLTWVLFEKGLPETQAALVAMVQDWFAEHSRTGDVPEESTIRKRLAMLWQKLRGERSV